MGAWGCLGPTCGSGSFLGGSTHPRLFAVEEAQAGQHALPHPDLCSCGWWATVVAG